MIRNYTIAIATTAAVLFSACGGDKATGGLEAKKDQLAKLKKEHDALNTQILKLEAEIAQADTTKANTNAKLVAAATLNAEQFVHYIDLQARVDADDISYIAPRGMGGVVKQLLVKKGDFVKKGQLVVVLDDAIMKQNVAAAKQSLETIKVQLDFAKNLYQRQKNLWDQNIGTEVQLLSAKNNVESLEKNLKAAQEQVKVAEEQLKTSLVYSDVSGVADEVNVRIGEAFVGATALGPQIKIVNTNSLKVIADVPENYLGKVKQGTQVKIVLPDLSKEYNSTVALAGRTINASTRAFEVEAKIPFDANIRPNQLANIKIQDYTANNAIAIPVNTVQTDEKGKFVYIAEKENGKLVARKKAITVGELYGTRIEVRSGLTVGIQLITEGYQDLYDGQVIEIK